MTIDLHIHSHCSDGIKSPAELVWLASKTGVSAIAITDHDAMDGVSEAEAVSDEYAVEVIHENSRLSQEMLTRTGF